MAGPYWREEHLSADGDLPDREVHRPVGLQQELVLVAVREVLVLLLLLLLLLVVGGAGGYAGAAELAQGVLQFVVSAHPQPRPRDKGVIQQ